MQSCRGQGGGLAIQPEQGGSSSSEWMSAELLCLKHLFAGCQGETGLAAGRSHMASAYGMHARKEEGPAKGMPHRCMITSRAADARKMAQK